MGITDLPEQITKALKYSLRSPSSFVVSLVGAMLVCAIAFDLLWSFAYVRWFDVKDAHYGHWYWLGVFMVAAVLPLSVAAVAVFRTLYRARPFGAGEIGIAIAPFEVFSVDPATLGTSSVLQALDIVGTQFFRVVENTMSEHAWAKDFRFRFLPPHLRIRNKDTALARRARLGATLVVWGVITQRAKEALEIRLELQGAVHNYSFTRLSVERFPMHALQLFILIEGAKTVLERGDKPRARELYQQALPLAAEVDASSGGDRGGMQADVQAKIAALG